MIALAAPLIDTHAHLTDRRFSGDVEQTLDRARDAGVVAFLVVGYDLVSSAGAVDLAARHADVWASVGIHPHKAADADETSLAEVERLSHAARVVAIGECGLDFYRNLAPPEKQRRVFAEQLALAAARNLPAIVHSRDAMAETLTVLASQSPSSGGVMHCFDGTVDDARRTCEAGFYVSFAGPITYRKDSMLRQAAAGTPADRVLVETDCPYLAPAAHRGDRNEPAFLGETAEAVARARGVRFEEMARQTTENARRLFRLT